MGLKAEHVPGELRDVDVQFISLVDKGANGRQFKIFKSAEAPEPSDDHEIRSFFELIKRFFKGESAEKAESESSGEALMSFSALIGQREMRQDLDEARWLLRDVMEAILRSEAVNKAELVAKAIDEFKAYVVDRIQRIGIAKALKEISVEKVGRKISAARLQKLKEALAALQSIVDEVEADDQNNETEGEAEVKKEELLELVKGAVSEAVAPLEERIAKLESEGEAVDQEGFTAETVAEMVKKAVGEAVKPLEARLEKVEKARGMSNAERVERVEKSGESFWGGIFLD